VKETIAVVAALLAVAGNIPYVLDVIRGKVKPHPYTWLVWSIVSATVFFGMLVKGAGIGALPTAASEIFTVIIFFLSLKYGFRNIARIDHVYLAIALAGFIPWIITKDPTVSIVIAVSIDLLAFMPTLRKTWQEPATENPILFGTNVLRHILSLFSLQTYNIATTLHSVAMIITNTAMVMVIYIRKGRGRE
jgi:hypothetical protein